MSPLREMIRLVSVMTDSTPSAPTNLAGGGVVVVVVGTAAVVVVVVVVVALGSGVGAVLAESPELQAAARSARPSSNEAVRGMSVSS
jgi:ABC-type phosphate transport system permease subunit